MNETQKYLLSGVEESIRALGGGGYGTVFLGKWKGSGVAIKRLHPVFMGLNQDNMPTNEFVKFMNEFHTLRGLAHPAVVQVYGLIEPTTRGGSHGVVMELLAVSLKERYSQVPSLVMTEHIGIFLNIASAVDYLHQKNILHRDVSTSNIMLTEAKAGTDGVLAKLVDIGVARVIEGDAADELTLTMAPGSDRYMAPETMQSPDDNIHYGRPADIYSLVVSVMAMLIKREPPTLRSLYKSGRGKDIEELRMLHHTLFDIIMQGLSEKPEDRPTAAELCKRLILIPASLEDVCTPTNIPGGMNSGGDEVGLQAQLDRVSAQRDSTSRELRDVTAERDRLRSEKRQHRQQLEFARLEKERLQKKLEEAQGETPAILGANTVPSNAPAEYSFAGRPSPMQKDTEGSQQKPLVTYSNDEGLMARCVQLFSVKNTPPSISSLPKWMKEKSLPLHGEYGTGIPCIHGDYIYCGFKCLRAGGKLVLYCIAADGVGKEAWQLVALPDGDWHPYAYFFSHNNNLYGILYSLSGSSAYAVYCRDKCDRWQLVTSLPQEVFNFGIALLDSILVIVGGAKSFERGAPALPSAYEVDLSHPEPQFAHLPDLPCACMFPQAITLGNWIHVLGHEVSMPATEDKVISLDRGVSPAEQRWSCDVLPPVPYMRCGVVVMNGCIVVMGGWDEEITFTNHAYMYVPECRKYLKLPSLNAVQARTSCLCYNNALYVLPRQLSGNKEIEILSISC